MDDIDPKHRLGSMNEDMFELRLNRVLRIAEALLPVYLANFEKLDMARPEKAASRVAFAAARNVDTVLFAEEEEVRHWWREDQSHQGGDDA